MADDENPRAHGPGGVPDAESLLEAYLAGSFRLPMDVAALGDDDLDDFDEDDLGELDILGMDDRADTGLQPGPALRPINLNLLSAADASEYWPELDGWVHWLRRDYGLGVTIIPPLWHRHAELRWELSALHTAWLAAYDPEAHAGSPVNWHRELSESIRRLHEWVSQSGTSLVEDRPTPVTLWPGEPGFGAQETWTDAATPVPISDRQADFRTWMDADIARRRDIEEQARAHRREPMLDGRALRPSLRRDE
ncbi:hypothetical protein [Antribacter gilvus]|uniref:hypothetical protein n=1 Tax=Antribacter gilvus TaxID=2304675 RepID=UPI00197D30D2|nr:hypothetical protein [Antribacter gilvus]